jgi:hypothetical protein
MNQQEHLIHMTREEIGEVEVNVGTLRYVILNFVKSNGLTQLLEWVEEKNRKYGNSWAQDGLTINFADIKDKLNRLDVILTDGNLREEVITADGYGDVILDLWVRATLCLIWDKHVKEFILRKYNIDLDE